MNKLTEVGWLERWMNRGGRWMNSKAHVGNGQMDGWIDGWMESLFRDIELKGFKTLKQTSLTFPTSNGE